MKHVDKNISSNIYYNNTDKILDISSKEFLSLIDLVKDNNRIFVCLPDLISPKLYSQSVQIHHPELRIDYGTDKENSYNMLSQLIYVNSEHLKCKLFRNQLLGKQTKFADLLVIANNDLENYHNLSLITLLLYADSNNLIIPKIILDSSLKLNDIGINMISPQNEIIYDNKDISIENKINNIISNEHFTQNDKVILSGNSDVVFTNILIYVPDILAAQHLSNSIAAVFSALSIVTVDNNSSGDVLESLLQPKSKVIIAIDVEVLPLLKVDIVIDLMRKYRERKAENFDSLGKYGFITKDSADNHINYISIKKCYRFIDRNTFDRLREAPVKKTRISTTFLDKYIHLLIMDFYQINIDPAIAFDYILKRGKYHTVDMRSMKERMVRDIRGMTKLDMISKSDNLHIILPLSIFSKGIPVSYQNSCFLWKWIHTNYSIYPGIVLASILHYNRRHFNSFPYLKESEKFVFDQLSIWNDFIEFLGSLHYYYIANFLTIKNKKFIYRWIRDNKLDYHSFNKLIKKVHKIYVHIKSNYRIKNLAIKYFESNEILQYGKALYRNILE